MSGPARRGQSRTRAARPLGRLVGDRGQAARPALRLRDDRGQVTVEFLGMMPTIILTLVLLWQFVLVGYTFTLAGNAADEAVRAGTATEGQAGCEEAGLRHLPDAWEGGAGVECEASGGYVTADVSLEVPVLFPGAIGFPFTVEGHAGAVQEEKD